MMGCNDTQQNNTQKNGTQHCNKYVALSMTLHAECRN